MPEPTAVQRSDRRWTIRFRPAERFAAVQYPEWAQSIARRYARSAHVRLGQVGETTRLVEVVAVSRYRFPSRADAVDVAQNIAEDVEA